MLHFLLGDTSGSLTTTGPWFLRIRLDPEIQARLHGSASTVIFLKASPEVLQQVDEEVQKLLEKKAIRPVERSPDQFLSQLFTVPKKDKTRRPVINLKPLNAFLCRSHFKMEGICMLRDLMKEGDWIVLIDLKDAYLTVPVAEFIAGSLFPLESSDIQVPVSALWSLKRSKGVHQNYEATKSQIMRHAKYFSQ